MFKKANSCIVSNFYIKSQLFRSVWLLQFRCIVSNFYIKSQLLVRGLSTLVGCIVSNFYIKSQLRNYYSFSQYVV